MSKDIVFHLVPDIALQFDNTAVIKSVCNA